MKGMNIILLAVILTGCKVEQKPVLYWYKPGATERDVYYDYNYSSLLPTGEDRMKACGYEQLQEYQLPEGVKKYHNESDRYHLFRVNYACDINAYEAQRENYIKSHPARPQYIFDAMRAEEITKGMTTEEVLLSWNNKFNKSSLHKYKTSEGFEAYIIGTYTLFFQNNILISWVSRG